MSTDPQLHASGGRQAEDDAAFPEDPRFRIMRRLVNGLLVVMIAGVLSITIALLLSLKKFQAARPAAGLTAQERILTAEATAERIALTIENVETGARRVVILDGRDFSPIGEIDER